MPRDPRARGSSPLPFRSPWEPPTLASEPPDPQPHTPQAVTRPNVSAPIEATPLNTSLVGQTFGRYQILSVIQRGGMGEIFLAEIVEGAGRGGRAVLKRLLADFHDDGAYANMFQDEMRIMSRLNHPNIVHVLDIPMVDGKQCLALEFVQGRNLLQVLKRLRQGHSVLPPQLALYVMGKVLEGLEHAHRAAGEDGQPLELVHRDVTPGNILLNYDGAVKITDFGIAKSRMSQVATSVGVVKGTTRYLSPEQIQGEPVTARTDLYSAAVVLTEMLTGIPLYDRGSVPPTLFAIVRKERPPINELLPFNAPRLSAMIERALSINPADRFASAREMADALGLAQWDLGQPVDRADLSAFLHRVYHDSIDLQQATLTKPDSLDLTYLFDVADAGLGKGEPEVVPPQVIEETRAALKDTVSGAKPLDANQFAMTTPRPGPPPERPAASDPRMRAEMGGRAPKDVRLLNITVPVSSQDIEYVADDPAASAADPFGEQPPTEPGDAYADAPRNDAVLEVLDRVSAELEAVERRRSEIPPLPLEAPPVAHRVRGIVLFCAGLAAGIALVSWPFGPSPPKEELAPAPIPRVVEAPPVEVSAPVEAAMLEAVLPTEPAAPAVVERAYLDVRGPRGARVRIDGVLQKGRAPLLGLAVEPGSRTIKISKGRVQRTIVVDVEPATRHDVTSEPVKRTRTE